MPTGIGPTPHAPFTLGKTVKVEVYYLSELSEIQSIIHESRYYTLEGASEAALNDGVTSRVLFLAMRIATLVTGRNV
jgi:hypothetical protein